MDLFTSNAQLFAGIAVGLIIAFPLLAAMHWYHTRIGIKKDAKIAAKDAKIAELEPLVFIDVLTGTGNRRKFDDALASLVPHAMRAGEPLVILYLDVNDFKKFNDRFGHPFGDRVLRRVSESIGDAVRPTDIVCRFGGDEFAVILPHCGIPGATIVAGRIARSLAANAVSRDDEQVHPCVSIGGTCLDTKGGQILVGGKLVGSFNESGLFAKIPPLLRQGADNRLYVAKQRKESESYPTEIS
ncbi:MAG: GGDEF domain-containing protein [Candidatus Uhrbacteria bacterium]